MLENLRDSLESLSADYGELIGEASTFSDATVAFLDQLAGFVAAHPGLTNDLLATSLVTRLSQAALQCQSELHAALCNASMANAQRKRDQRRPAVITGKQKLRPLN